MKKTKGTTVRTKACAGENNGPWRREPKWRKLVRRKNGSTRREGEDECWVHRRRRSAEEEIFFKKNLLTFVF